MSYAPISRRRRNWRNLLCAAAIAQACGLAAVSTRGDVTVSGDTLTIVHMPDGTWHSSLDVTNATFNVGISGNGTMVVTGAEFVSPTHSPLTDNFPSISIGGLQTATGNVHVNGGLINAQGLIEVGEFGTGFLTIDSGGSVQAYEFTVGGQITGNGTVSINSSTLHVGDNLLVGNQGLGAMNVAAASQVFANFAVIGGNGTGLATFDASNFTMTHDLIVGGANNGSLTLQNGSILTAVNLILGDQPSGDGVMNVIASSINCSGTFSVGYNYYSIQDVVNMYNGSTANIGDLEVGFGGVGTFVVGGTKGGRIGTPDNSGLQTTLTAGIINIGGGQFDAAGVQSALYVINGSLVSSGDVGVSGVDGLAEVFGFSAAGLRSIWNADNLSVTTGDLGGGLIVSSGGLLTSTSGTVDDGAAIIDGTSHGFPSTWKIQGPLWIGAITGDRPNTLEITNGALLQSGDASLGDINKATGSGSMLVDGTGSIWNAGNVTVGNGFNFTLYVSGGGLVSAQSLYILGNGAGSGELDVTDVGSMLKANGDILTVGGGDGGQGVLMVSAGGAAISGHSVIGGSLNSIGQVTLDGLGSSWTIHGDLSVGDVGTGQMTISNSATVSAGRIFIGPNVNTNPANGPLFSSNGMVTVQGGGSQLAAAGWISDGGFGTGEIDIQSGGKVTAQLITVGNDPGGSGIIRITGVDASGPSMLTADEIHVGERSKGLLTLGGGAQLTVQFLYAGFHQNADLSLASGSVTLDGTKTAATVAQTTIGESGAGVMVLTNLAKLTTGSLGIGDEVTFVGLVRVDGSMLPPENSSASAQQTTVLVNGDVTVANLGKGELDVQNGGLLNAVNGWVADAGGSGVAAVTGNLSLWKMAGNLSIGGVGRGAAVVNNSANLMAVNLEMARVNNGTGANDLPDASLSISGGSVNFSGTAIIGDAGVASLVHNGTLNTGATILGNTPTGAGNALIQGGTWSIAGSLTVAAAGRATLEVDDGVLKGQAAVIGDQAGAIGTLIVGKADQAHPLVTLSGALMVSNNGRGSVVINNGDLTANSVTLGVNMGTTGEIQLTSAGAMLEVANKLTVGQSGSGILGVHNGAHVFAQSITLGNGGAPNHQGGEFDVTGAGSEINIFSGLTVGGASGQGSLSLGGNSAIFAASTSIGTSSLNPATIGTGQAVITTGTLNAGKLTVNSGSSLLVQSGGKVIATGATFGGGHFLAAQATFDGAGTSLNCGTGTVVVGGFGAADLEVDHGATITSATVAVHVDGILQGDGGNILGKVMNDGGTVHPGDSPGILTIVGDYQQSDGLLDVEFTGIAASQRDTLDVQGNASLTGGIIQFSFLDGYLPKAGDILPFLSFDGTAPDLSGLTYQTPGVASDFQYAVTPAGNQLELVALSNASAAPVPEPTTGLLLVTGVAALMRRRRAIRNDRPPEDAQNASAGRQSLVRPATVPRDPRERPVSRVHILGRVGSS